MVLMEWHAAGLSVCLPLLTFPCTIKSRSSLLAPAHPGGPGKRVVKQLLCAGGYSKILVKNHQFLLPHWYLAPHLGVTHCNFTETFGIRKLKSLNINNMMIFSVILTQNQHLTQR